MPAEDPFRALSLQTISSGLVDESVFPHDVEHGDPGETSRAPASGTETAAAMARRGGEHSIVKRYGVSDVGGSGF